MKGLLKVKDIILKQCCIVMNYTLNQFRPIYHQAISDVNENGIRAALWAKRGDILTDEFMSDDTVKVLHIKRGNLWQIDPVADLENGDLYILINKKNLDQRIKEAKRAGWSTHYLYSVLLKNSYIKVECPEEILLFPQNQAEKKEHKKWRQEDCQKILGDLYDTIKRIIVISVEYEGEIAATAHAIIYDAHYNVAEEKDISDYLLTDSYDQAAPIAFDNKSNKVQPLVRLKPNDDMQKRDDK